jgi:anti-anti-sigma factor
MSLAGQLTLKTLFDFQNAIREEMTKPLILDLEKVEYMDSAGLGSVIGAFSSCQRSGRGFGIVGVSGRIRVLFQVTKVDGLLPCFDSLAAAEASVAAGA